MSDRQVLALITPRHPMKAVTLRPFELQDLESVGGAREQYVSLLNHWGHVRQVSVTIRSGDDRTVLCFGVLIGSPGLGDAWLLPGPALGEYRREAYVHVFRTMLLTAAAQQLRRIQATTRFSRPWDGRFLERLGFECEGRLRKLYDDDDALMYARVF